MFKSVCGLFVCLFVCMYVCMFFEVCLYLYIFRYVYICMYVSIYDFMYACFWVFPLTISRCMYMYQHPFINAQSYTFSRCGDSKRRSREGGLRRGALSRHRSIRPNVRLTHICCLLMKNTYMTCNTNMYAPVLVTRYCEKRMYVNNTSMHTYIHTYIHTY